LRSFFFAANPGLPPALLLASRQVFPVLPSSPGFFTRRPVAVGPRARPAQLAAYASCRIHQRQRPVHWPFRAALGYAPLKTHFWACRGDRASACADESPGPPEEGGRVCLL